ncbi:MAG TPA: hypothetical protein EYH35_01355 [Thiotrichaceae bacterium]|nr:hypothetical protein [Thiotrichaceae bacterium]
MNKPNKLYIFLFACILPITSYSNDLSYQGISGVFITPDAHLLEEGRLSYQYNNHIEDNLKASNKEGRNHVFSIGLSHYVEIGGRLTDFTPLGTSHNSNGTKRGKRDLSGNIKIKIPKLRHWMPEIALGVNDFAGEAVNFRSQYGVMTKSLSALKLSAGYAVGDNVNFNGKFSSLQYNFTPQFSLSAEYDTQKSQVGINYNLSNLLHIPLQIKISRPVKSDSSSFVGIGFTLPLNRQTKHKKLYNGKSQAVTRDLSGSEESRLAKLQAKLESYGLEDIKIGKDQPNSYLVFINNRVYNHSMMDAAAIALGTIQEVLPNESTVKLIFTQHGYKEFYINTKIAALANYLKNGSSTHFKQQLTLGFIPNNFTAGMNIKWYTNNATISPTRLNLKLSPSIANSVGHEWGVYDYSLALKADAKLNLWQGGNLLVSGEALLHASDNYKQGGVFHNGLHQSGVKQVLLQQYIKPSKQLSALASIGKMTVNKYDFNTTQLEARWMSPQGGHQLSTHLAYFDSRDNTTVDRRLALASYEYNFKDSDWSAEVTQGEFFQKDVGTRMRLKKRFGNTTIATYINYIKEDNISGGLSLTSPLTPRKDYKNNSLVIRGDPAWKYSLTTTIEDNLVPGSNRLRPNMMLEPKLGNSLSADYLDSNRLTSRYFMSNIDELRQIYFSLRH